MRFLTLTPSELLPDRSTSHTVSLKTTEELGQLSGSTLHRSSPIHPLITEATVPDLEHGGWRIHFLVTDDPFSPPRGNLWVGERSIEAAVRGSGGSCGRLLKGSLL